MPNKKRKATKRQSIIKTHHRKNKDRKTQTELLIRFKQYTQFSLKAQKTNQQHTIIDTDFLVNFMTFLVNGYTLLFNCFSFSFQNQLLIYNKLCFLVSLVGHLLSKRKAFLAYRIITVIVILNKPLDYGILKFYSVYIGIQFHK